MVAYHALRKEDAPHREHCLREVFNWLRWFAKAGQTGGSCPTTCRRGMRSSISRGTESAWGASLTWRRICAGWAGSPGGTPSRRRRCWTRTLQTSPEGWTRAGYDWAKLRNGSKVHLAADTIGHLPVLVLTPANAQERAEVTALAEQVQQVTGGSS